MNREEIYNEYYKRVLNYIYGKVLDYDLAEDITSAVFVKVVSKYDEFDLSKGSVSTWIFTIANNTLIDYYRTRKVHEDIADKDFASGEDIESGILSEETMEELADALMTLEERERDLVVLHYYENYTLKEIAMKMGMSYANVKVVHKKALDKLKGVLGDILTD